MADGAEQTLPHYGTVTIHVRSLKSVDFGKKVRAGGADASDGGGAGSEALRGRRACRQPIPAAPRLWTGRRRSGSP